MLSKHAGQRPSRSETTTTATGLATGGVSGGGGDILDSADLETVSGKSSDGRLGAGTGGLRHDTTLGTELDVDSVDANSLQFTADVDGGEHSGVGGGLLSVGLDFHTTGDSAVGFTAGQISNVDEGVVEGRLDVADAELVVLLGSGGTTDLGGSVVGNNLLFTGFDLRGLLSFLVDNGSGLKSSIQINKQVKEACTHVCTSLPLRFTTGPPQS